MLDISFGEAVNDGMRDMGIQAYCEDTHASASFRMPVPAKDSISEMETDAKIVLRSFLEQLLNEL